MYCVQNSERVVQLRKRTSIILEQNAKIDQWNFLTDNRKSGCGYQIKGNFNENVDLVFIYESLKILCL